MPPKTMPNNQRKRKGKVFKPLPSRPLAFDPRITTAKRFRYICGTATTFALSFYDLFFLLATPFSATVISSLISAIRIRKIQVWQTGTIPTTGGPGTITMLIKNTGAGGIGIKPIILTDTSQSNNTFARLQYIPNKASVFGSWQNTINTTTISTLAEIDFDINVGDTVDFLVEYLWNTGDPIVTATYATSGITTNQIFGAELPTASGQLLPMLKNTI